MFHLILISRESDGGAIFWLNPHSLGVVHFQVFRLILRLFHS